MFHLKLPFVCIFLYLFCFPFLNYAQRETDYWYFGKNAGLDFSSGVPEPLTDGKMNTYEGCTTLSDSLGNLFFYTDGKTVWNKEDSLMKNGSDLFGHSSSAQSALAVWQPGNSRFAYLFTADVLFDGEDSLHEHKGFQYSIIDRKKEQGRGEVIEKNHPLLDSVTERLTAVKHQNQRDIWILTHEWGSDRFFAYKLTPEGISPAVISSAGSVHRGLDHLFLDAIGQMKASPSGNKIVVGNLSKQNYEMFDFNRQTGAVSFFGELDFPYYSYGCSFSPNGKYLYMTNKNKTSGKDELWQADVTGADTAAINSSLQLIHTFDDRIHPGSMQNAPNGKTYIAIDNHSRLYAINKPDSAGMACDLEEDAVDLDGRYSRLGLPDFPPYFFKNPDFRAKNLCFGDTSRFVPAADLDYDSLLWQFGDTQSGSQNISREPSPKHHYKAPGSYPVRLQYWKSNILHTCTRMVKILAPPALDLGTDTVFCLKKQDTLYARGQHWDVLWNDLSRADSLWVKTDGQYSVKVENTYTSCRKSDTIQIQFSEPLNFSLGEDTLICLHSPLELSVASPSSDFLWQNGSKEHHFLADTSGIYTLQITTALGCISSDSIEIRSLPAPTLSFPPNQELCEGKELLIEPKSNTAVTLRWQDASTSDSYWVTQAGSYWAEARNLCGVARDSIEIRYAYCGDIYIPNVFTPNADTHNEYFAIKGIDKEAWDLYIYNRWGQEVYAAPDYQSRWNGIDKKGNILSAGTYYYLLIRPTDNKQYKGFVHIRY